MFEAPNISKLLINDGDQRQLEPRTTKRRIGSLSNQLLWAFRWGPRKRNRLSVVVVATSLDIIPSASGPVPRNFLRVHCAGLIDCYARYFVGLIQSESRSARDHEGGRYGA